MKDFASTSNQYTKLHSRCLQNNINDKNDINGCYIYF